MVVKVTARTVSVNTAALVEPARAKRVHALQHRWVDANHHGCTAMQGWCQGHTRHKDTKREVERG